MNFITLSKNQSRYRQPRVVGQLYPHQESRLLLFVCPTNVSIGLCPQGHRMVQGGCQSSDHHDQDHRKVEMQQRKQGLFSAMSVPFKHPSQKSHPRVTHFSLVET